MGAVGEPLGTGVPAHGFSRARQAQGDTGDHVVGPLCALRSRPCSTFSVARPGPLPLLATELYLGHTPPRRSLVVSSQWQISQDGHFNRTYAAALRKAGRFAFDTETTSLDPRMAQLVGMSFCWGASEAVYVPIAHESGGNCPGAIDVLAPILADPKIKKTGQNLGP